MNIEQQLGAKNEITPDLSKLYKMIENDGPRAMNAIQEANDGLNTEISVDDAFSPETAKLIKEVYATHGDTMRATVIKKISRTIGACSFAPQSDGLLKLAWGNPSLYGGGPTPTAGDEV